MDSYSTRSSLDSGTSSYERVMVEEGSYSVVFLGSMVADTEGVPPYELRKNGKLWHESDDVQSFQGLADPEVDICVEQVLRFKSRMSLEHAGSIMRFFSKIDARVVEQQRETLRGSIHSVGGIGEPAKVLKVLPKLGEVALRQMELCLRNACEGDVSRLDQSLRQVHTKVLETLIGKEIKKDERKVAVDCRTQVFPKETVVYRKAGYSILSSGKKGADGNPTYMVRDARGNVWFSGSFTDYAMALAARSRSLASPRYYSAFDDLQLDEPETQDESFGKNGMLFSYDAALSIVGAAIMEHQESSSEGNYGQAPFPGSRKSRRNSNQGASVPPREWLDKQR